MHEVEEITAEKAESQLTINLQLVDEEPIRFSVTLDFAREWIKELTEAVGDQVHDTEAEDQPRTPWAARLLGHGVAVLLAAAFWFQVLPHVEHWKVTRVAADDWMFENGKVKHVPGLRNLPDEIPIGSTWELDVRHWRMGFDYDVLAAKRDSTGSQGNLFMNQYGQTYCIELLPLNNQ